MKKMKHIVLIPIIYLVWFSAYAYGAENEPAPNGRGEILQESLKQPSAHLPVIRYEFAPVIEGQEVIYDFVVQNKGSATLEIQKVKTD